MPHTETVSHFCVPALFRRAFSCLLLLALMAIAPLAAAQSYVFKTIDDPNVAPFASGFLPNTNAAGINDLGIIVGSYTHPPSTDNRSAFEDSNGSFSTIDFPGGIDGSFADGINNSGVVVGFYNDDVLFHGYTLANGNYSTFDFPGANVSTFPSVINNHGVIVGSYQNEDGSFHGFIYNGSFSTFECPTSGQLESLAINDTGDMVGTCILPSNPSSGFKFTAATRQTTPISFPGAFSSSPVSINNSGQIVGTYLDGNTDLFHGFLFFNGNYQQFDVPGSIQTFAGTINNLGQIVGQYQDATGYHGFLATQAGLVDPVPDLLSGNAVRPLNSPDDAQILATKGQAVQGVAADGVTEVVVRIPAVNVGDQFTVTVLNDGTGKESISSDEDGAVGNPGDTTFSQLQMAVTAVATTSDANNPSPMAFAVYRAPIDFARPTSSGGYKSGSCMTTPPPPGTAIVGASVSDDQSACRTVTLAIQQGGPNFSTGPSQGININLPVFILRPPVVLIHGIWGSWQSWNNFKPLVTGVGTVDSRFSVGRVNYDNNISDLVASTAPFFLAGNLKGISSNSLGFAYNAPVVQQQIEHWIEEFKSGTNSQGIPTNPLGIQAAGVQADIVVHSMGGVIARTIAGQDTFLSGDTFAQGDIHKLITIDTPHLGSPVAIQILADSHGEDAGCVQNVLADFGDFPLKEVDFSNGGSSATGAVADLEGDDTQPVP